MHELTRLFIGLMPFLMPVLIIWIIFHYRSKRLEKSALSEEELQQLDELNEAAERMAERIKTLESILDAENPEWRDYHGQR